MRVVAGLVENWARANRAVEQLVAAGLDPASVVIVRDPQGAYESVPESGAEVPTGAVGGVGLGGIVGGILGWIADAVELVTEVAVIELEEALSTGPLAAALDLVDPLIAFGAGVGALAGGLLGIHAGWSFVEDTARAYRTEVARGRVLLRVGVPDRRAARLAELTLRRAGAERIRSGLAGR